MTRGAAETKDTPVLGDEHVTFMSSDAISSAISSRDASNQPSLTKCLAVRVSGDQGTVEVFVDADRSVDVLRDLRAGNPIALVCSEPMSHRTIQVKGARAEIGPVAPDDWKFIAARVEAIIAHIAPLGYPEDGLRVYFSFTPSALTRIVFAASAAFLQTPGPGAGAPLKT
jgi:hypothetical protein